MSSTSVTIRPTRRTDNDALSRICLLTGAAGSSAEASHSIPELLGLIYAVPYNLLDTTFGFVLVDTDAHSPDSVSSTDNGQGVVGYILGTADSKRFEGIAEREWWPTLRDKYPKGNDPHRYRPVVYIDWRYIENLANVRIDRKQADERCISNIHSPSTTPKDITSRFPAHIHIDILPSYQRKSYGRKLMVSAVAFLQEKGHTGLFVGLDPSNESAKKFYGRLGFERIDREGGEWWGLDFDRFQRG